MTNYQSRMRTSYFQVNDEEAFRQELTQLEAFNETIAKDDEGRLCIYGENFDILHEPQDQGDDLEVDVFAILAKHMVDGEAILVNSIGYEGYRYVNAQSTIITHGTILAIDPEFAVKQQAVDQNLLTPEQANRLRCEY